MGDIRVRILYNIPVAPAVLASLTVPHPLTASEWDQMMRVLEAMKPGLVEEHAESPEGDRHPATEATGGMEES